MTKPELDLLDKISKWNLWRRNIKLPISQAEAELIQHRLLSALPMRCVNQAGPMRGENA